MGKAHEVEKIKRTRKKDNLPTKVVIRRLPPGLTEDEFRKELGELPDHDYFAFHGPDFSLETACFSRAYINFIEFADIYGFKNRFDHHTFVCSNGFGSPAVVELAQFQGVPRTQVKKRKDPRSGTIEDDPDYLAFLESLSEEKEPTQSAEVYLEQLEIRKAELKASKEVTPLLEFIKARRAAKNAHKQSSNEKRQRREQEGEKEGRPARKKTDDVRKSSGKKAGPSKPSPSEKPPKDNKKLSETAANKIGSKKSNEKYHHPDENTSTPQKNRGKQYPIKPSRTATTTNNKDKGPSHSRDKAETERATNTSSTPRKATPIDSEKRNTSKDYAELKKPKDQGEPQMQDKGKRKNKDRPEIAIYRPPSRPGSSKSKDSKATKDKMSPRDREKKNTEPEKDMS